MCLGNSLKRDLNLGWSRTPGIAQTLPKRYWTTMRTLTSPMVALCGRCLVQHYDGMFHRKFNGRSVRNFRDDLWWQLSIEHHKQHSVIHRITGLEPSRVKRVQNTITLHEELWSWLQRHLLIPFICQWIPANCCQESLHFRLTWV